MSKKLAFLATTALAGTLMLATNAMAQSTGTTEVEEVTITAATGPANVSGAVVDIKEPKARTAITQDFISKQQAGQSVVQTLNASPGVSFVNSDPYGSSGGNLRIRGYDGNRISLTFDGIPLNDTGNYAIFTNQQVDPELISQATVNLGTTDVDSPTASATGGTINYTTLKPTKDGSAMFQPSVGSFTYRRLFGLVQTGELGPFGTTAWLSASYQKYSKFKGPGELEKMQINGKIYQDLGDNGDFFAVAFHYNQNRNAFYRNVNKSQIAFYGWKVDNLDTCKFDTGNNPRNDGASPAGAGAYMTANDNPANPSSCTNYYGLRDNPSNTGNIRGQFKYHLMDNLILTVDPSFQYVLANGGGTATIGETDARLKGTAAVAGVDLNGDGDTNDTIRFYTPNNTNTRRYGLTSSLIWDFDEHNRLRVAYTVDYGRHRQTGEWGYLDSAGNPEDVFGGKDGHGRKVQTADGSFIRGRDRYSIAELNQIAVEYRGQFFDDRLLVNIGVRNPHFQRDLHQYCYTQNASTIAGVVAGSSVTCTTQIPNAAAPDGSVTFGASATKFIKPFNASVKYTKVLPNVGLSWKLDDNSGLFFSYAQGLSAPRTDNLYTAELVGGVARPADVAPEKSKEFDLGYRYNTHAVLGSVTIWYNEFQNRIVSSFDPDTGISIDRNVGAVKLYGVDAQVGWRPVENWTLVGVASYNHSEVQDNLRFGTANASNPVYAVGTPLFLNIKGKRLVETPTWTLFGRAEWDATQDLHFGFQAKYVGKRFSTDINDESSPAFTTADLDLRYDLPMVDSLLSGKGAYLQLNVTNIFDKKYLGNISSQTNAVNIPGLTNSAASNAQNVTYSIGAPRTVMLSLRVAF
jgi:iron complex outermembrane receptor protein